MQPHRAWTNHVWFLTRVVELSKVRAMEMAVRGFLSGGSAMGSRVEQAVTKPAQPRSMSRIPRLEGNRPMNREAGGRLLRPPAHLWVWHFAISNAGACRAGSPACS
jgi:hypothetical protein